MSRHRRSPIHLPRSFVPLPVINGPDLKGKSDSERRRERRRHRDHDND